MEPTTNPPGDESIAARIAAARQSLPAREPSRSRSRWALLGVAIGAGLAVVLSLVFR